MCQILNNDPNEVLNYRSPFEVCFARKQNSFKTFMDDDEIIENVGKCEPSKADRKRRVTQAKEVGKMAKMATDRCNRQMV